MALTRAQVLKMNSVLYEAMIKRDDARVIHLCRGLPKGPLHILSMHGDTVLHMAIYQKKSDLALKLLDMVTPCETHKLTAQNNGGNTILHETGTNNKTVKVAEKILSRAPMLLNMTNKEGETALFYAARHGKTKIYMFLHDEVGRTTEGYDLKTNLRRDDRFTLLHIAILSRNYRVAYDVAINHSELIAEKDADDMTALQLFSTIKPEFRPKGFFKRLIFKLINSTDADIEPHMFSFVKKWKRQKHACEWAMKIAALLIKADKSWEKTESWTDNRGYKFHEQNITPAPQANSIKPDTPLLLATKCDSTGIVREILKLYPQAAEHVDEDGRNILHLAILHRRYEIIDAIEAMEYPLDRLTGRVDKNHNTLLHMVGQREDELEEDVKHPAQMLHDDQRLFMRVEKLCTSLDAATRNSDQKTPYEVFSEANNGVRSLAKDWMRENAKHCSIVAVLIATVAFASAYTIPGGPGKNGHPVLRDHPMFIIFTFADAISLSTALASVIMCLNILTSSFQFTDFASSLFTKQFIALILLCSSVITMMVAFAATLVITINQQTELSNVILYGVSCFPVIVFIYSYVLPYLDLIKDFHGELKKVMGKVLWFKIWDNKSQSSLPANGTALGSLV